MHLYMYSQSILCIFLAFCTMYMHSQKFHLYMHSNFIFFACINIKKNKSKKNHAFINTFLIEKDSFRHTLYMHS